MTLWDFVIVGAGIAGASLADALAREHRVLILEAEAQPGYHATGRSAAFWSETYGGPDIQPLTSASFDFLANPPSAFSSDSFLAQREALHIGTNADAAIAQDMLNAFAQSEVRLENCSRGDVQGRIVGLRPQWTTGVWEPDCCDILVAELHAAYLRSARINGVQLRCSAALQKAEFRDKVWTVNTVAGEFKAKTLINASGAWADAVARLSSVGSVGIKPYRRTVMQLEVEPSAPANLPLVIGLDGSFYFKPAAGGRIWLSPHDETPDEPGDVAADELDIAMAIDRFEQVVDWTVRRVEHKWAGLRSFSPDRLPVIGRDAMVPEFFWFVGQGGFGIQTAPAAAQLAASLLLDTVNAPAAIDPVRYSPDRFE